MKKLFALILTFIFISINNLAIAADSWEFNSTNTGAESIGYVPLPEPDTSYYSGKVETYSTVNTTPATTKVKTSDEKSFSDKHPIISGIGVGVGVLAIVGLALLTSDDDDYKDRHRYENRNQRHHGCHGDRDRCHYRR